MTVIDARKTFMLPKKPTREDFLAAIATWEDGGGVTGHYTISLHRYYKMLGPLVNSQAMTDEFEYVRRTMEARDA